MSTTAAMSATVPDCMWLRPWRLRPTPRTVPWPSSSISKTRALANSVPMSSAVQAASASPLVALPDAAPEGHQACPRCSAEADRRSRRVARCPSRRVPLPWAISGRPPPRPSIAARPSRTRSPAAMPRRDEVVADRHEQLRLVGLEAERDHARSASAADVLRRRPSARRSTRTGRRTRRGARPARPVLGPRRRARRASAGPLPPPGLQPPASSRAARPGAPRSGPRAASAVWAPAASAAALERRRRGRAGSASAPAPVSASIRRMPGADATARR